MSDVAVPGDGTVLPARPVIGILHPGAMGAALGSALKPVASGVVWAAAGRSQATSKRAELADLIGVPDLAELARRSHLVVSICPPHAALDVARQVAAAVEGAPTHRSTSTPMPSRPRPSRRSASCSGASGSSTGP
ncbi:hypothetical protein ACFQV8_19790 [Pseudonocardia benzenivorans]